MQSGRLAVTWVTNGAGPGIVLNAAIGRNVAARCRRAAATPPGGATTTTDRGGEPYSTRVTRRTHTPAGVSSRR